MSIVRLNKTILSPVVAFCAVWIFGALLSQVHLLNSQNGWPTVMVAVVVAVPFAFIAGGLIGEGTALWIAPDRSERKQCGSSTTLLRKILIVFVVIGFAELAHQFAKIGGVPLLSGTGNSLRFEQGGPTIILTDLLTVAAMVALVKPRNLLAKESRFELAIAIVALGGFALQAGRGSIVLPVIAAGAARWLYWGKPRLTALAAIAVFAFVAIAFVFYLRARQNPGNPFEAELFSEVLPELPLLVKPLMPVFLAIVTNFIALQGLIGHFPTEGAFGHGAYDAIGLHSFIGGTLNVSDVSATLTPPWVTSTVAGPLWADGGFAALVPGVAFAGFTSAGAFAMAKKTRSLRWSMVAGYFLFITLFGVYTNLWTQQLDWILISPLLLAVGAIVEDHADPPGLTGRVLAWVRRRRDGGEAPSTGKTPQPKRQLGKTVKVLMLAGVGLIVLLTVSGLIIQRLLPEPYPLVYSTRLPNGVDGSPAVMTSSDLPSDNERVVWLEPKGRFTEVESFSPTPAPPTVEHLARIKLPFGAREATYDVGAWPPWRAMALFSFQQRPNSLSITVSPTWHSDGKPVHFLAPISAPAEGATRDLMIATWGGSKPDLFILTRGPTYSRPLLQVLSGESGFQRQLLIERLPFRGLAASTWSVDVAQLDSLPPHDPGRTVVGTRPDLLLVHHGPDKKRSDVQVMLGESAFQDNAFRRDLDAPGTIPSSTMFLIGSHEGARSIFGVERPPGHRPHLRVFWLAPPPMVK